MPSVSIQYFHVAASPRSSVELCCLASKIRAESSSRSSILLGSCTARNGEARLATPLGGGSRAYAALRAAPAGEGESHRPRQENPDTGSLCPAEPQLPSHGIRTCAKKPFKFPRGKKPPEAGWRFKLPPIVPLYPCGSPHDLSVKQTNKQANTAPKLHSKLKRDLFSDREVTRI